MPNDNRRTPLDILVIGEHAHSSGYAIRALMQYFRDHPAVRAFGTVDNEADAWELIRGNKVNTIFIDANDYTQPNYPKFIKRVRKEFPKIVFVLHFYSADNQNVFFKSHPGFKHYFHINYLAEPSDLKRYGDCESLFRLERQSKELDEMLYRCEEWHNNLFQYDVALSFAGQDRQYANELAIELRTEGVRVFYDDFEQASLLGKNLHTHLYEVYSQMCRYCVLFISKAYTERIWTVHERTAAQERAIVERGDTYIIPIRIDNSRIPGLPDNIAYASIDLGTLKIASLIVQKLWMTDTNSSKGKLGKWLFERIY